MATYYVRKTGSDAAAGTATGTAWLTVTKAANTVAAGDTVYVGAGVYRELVTMVTSGNSSSQISYIADLAGTYTGDAGIVIITAHDDDYATAARVAAWDMVAKTFITMRGFIFVGSSGSGTFVVGNSSTASHVAYEGCIIEQCSFIPTGGSIGYNNHGLSLKVNQGVVPTASGLIVRQCKFLGDRGINVVATNQVTANNNLKWVIENCEFMALGGSSSGVTISIVGTNNTFGISGISIRHCTFLGYSQHVFCQYIKDTTNPITVYNCMFVGYSNAITGSLSTAGSVIENGNRLVFGTTTVATALSGVTIGSTTEIGGTWLPGYMVEHLLKTNLGWTPFDSLTPVARSGYTDPAIGFGGVANVAATGDVNGNLRSMGRPTKYGRLYYMDASDAAVTDPGAAWSGDALAHDTDITTLASTATAGSTSSNFLMAEGTDAPSSGATILNVYARVRAGTTSAQWNVVIYSDALGATLATITGTNTTVAWSSWSLLTVPSGGWTWAKVAALEFKAFRSAGSGTFSLYKIQISVDTAEVSPDVGAVESLPLPVQNSTDQYEGTYCMELAGAGLFSFWQPVSAASTTVEVRAKYDSNYTGTKPQLVITNISGVADQTATMTAASGTYELLSLTFTPTTASFVRVKLISNDTSVTGKCFFDDLRAN